MKEKDLVEMINGIDDDLIEEAESSGARGNKAPRRAFPGGLRVAAVAAVLFAIVLSVLLAWQYQQKGSSKYALVKSDERYAKAQEPPTPETGKKPSGGASFSEVLEPPNSYLPFYNADSIVYGTIVGKGSSVITNPDLDITILNSRGDIVSRRLVTDYILDVEETVYGTPEHGSTITIKVSNYVLEDNMEIEDYNGPIELQIGDSGFFFLSQSGSLQPAGEESWYYYVKLFNRLDTRDGLFYAEISYEQCAIDPWTVAEEFKAFKTLTKKSDKWKFIGSHDFREQTVLETADADDPLLKAKDDGVTAPTPRVALDGADIIVEGKIIEEMPTKVIDSRPKNTAGNSMLRAEIPQYVLRVDRVLRGDGAAIGEEITVGVENFVGYRSVRPVTSYEEEVKEIEDYKQNTGKSEVTFSEGKSGIFCLSYSEAYTDKPGDGIYLVVRRDDGVFEKGDDGVYRSANTVLTPEIMEEYGLLNEK